MGGSLKKVIFFREYWIIFFVTTFHWKNFLKTWNNLCYLENRTFYVLNRQDVVYCMDSIQTFLFIGYISHISFLIISSFALPEVMFDLRPYIQEALLKLWFFGTTSWETERRLKYMNPSFSKATNISFSEDFRDVLFKYNMVKPVWLYKFENISRKRRAENKNFEKQKLLKNFVR